MIKTECPKCKEELIQHDGYGVCSKCGEIVGYDVEEEIEEILTPPQPAEEEIIAEETEESEVFEEMAESIAEEEMVEQILSEEETVTEDVAEEAEEVAVVEEKTQEIKGETIINEEVESPKKKKTPFVILVIVILCILALLGGYFVSKVNWGTVDNDNIAPEENVIEEEPKEPKAVDEEPEEVHIQEPEKEETVAPKPVQAKQETPKKQTVKKEDAVITPSPSIAYRIRRTADDSDTQIGAFSDIERAKAFASSHAADGYKVYDMNGQLVFEP